jgi:dipeptidyl aminopeptidase/acylaminoacyl peptidase
MQKILLLVGLLITGHGIAQKNELESFISFSMASGFSADPQHHTVAWVENIQGIRNIYLSSNGKIMQLTNYQKDDGQELSNINFTPDGKKLIFVRGGAPNVQGANPNPASLTIAQSIGVYGIDVAGGEPYLIIQGSNYKISKSGEKLLLLKGGRIHEASLNAATNSAELFYDRGSISSFSESPDQAEILFTSERGDHSFIGIYNKAEHTLRWIAPEINHDQFPVWSPDGKQIAFIRMPGTQNGKFSNLTEGYRYDLIVADAKTGAFKKIWSSPDASGGFVHSYPSPVLSWNQCGKIIFFSEHTGWSHIWSINPDGSALTDHAPGDGEVESYTESKQDGIIYFDSNIGDINRRHIWKADLKTGKSVKLTGGDGIEMHPVVAGNELYCFRSGYNFSRTLARIEQDGKSFNDFKINAPKFKSNEFLVPEAVTFKAEDGTLIHGQLFINRNIKTIRPGLLYMHGGPTRQMLLGFHYSDYYSQCYAFNQYMAQQGYAVLSVNYRDGIGYGRKFRNAPDQGPRGAVEYQDIIAAGKYLQSLKEVNPAQIGLWGGSYGGYLTAMGLARNPELFKTGVDIHGVHNWAHRAKNFWYPGGWWGLSDNELALAYSNSPVSDLSRWQAPVLMIHGDDDRNVDFQETTDLAEKLRARGIEVELLVLPDEVHGFLRYESWKKIFTQSAEFLFRRLPR